MGILCVKGYSFEEISLMFNPEEEYQALLRSLHWKDGFGVLFVQCAPTAENRLVARIREDLPETVEVITLTQSDSLEDLVQALPNLDQVKTILVQGSESLLRDYEKSLLLGMSDFLNTSLLSNLQHLSEQLRQRFNIGFVFLLPKFVFEYCTQRASNFYHWHSVVEDLPEPPQIYTRQDPEIYNTWRNPGLWLTNLKTTKKEISALPTIDLLCNQGLEWINEEQYEEALKCFDRAVELEPENEEMWHNRGKSLAHLERYAEAATCFAHVIELNSLHEDAWFHQGYMLGLLGQHEAAIACYDATLILNPQHAEALNCRGRSLHNIKRYEEAIETFDRALEVNPEYFQVWHNRASSLNELERYEEAIASYDKVLEVEPQFFLAWNNRAYSLDELGQHEEAVANYDKALEIAPFYFIAWHNRATSLEALGRYDDALESYERGLGIYPNDSDMWCGRGVLLTKLGCYEAAIASYDCALTIQPNDADFAYNKACCYGLQKQVELAIRWLKQAVELDEEILDCAKTDSDFDGIRQDERFQAFLKSHDAPT
jgi:tetratricopeptide (TPR) repeat protein